MPIPTRNAQSDPQASRRATTIAAASPRRTPRHSIATQYSGPAAATLTATRCTASVTTSKRSSNGTSGAQLCQLVQKSPSQRESLHTENGRLASTSSRVYWPACRENRQCPVSGARQLWLPQAEAQTCREELYRRSMIGGCNPPARRHTLPYPPPTTRTRTPHHRAPASPVHRMPGISPHPCRVCRRAGNTRR